VQHSLLETIGRIPLFATSLDPLFQLDVFPLFKPLSASRGEVLLHRGDVPHDLHFLLKGKVEIVSGVDGRALYRLDQGAHFGESVLTGRRRSATHCAVSACEMFVISAADLSELFERRPREGRIIHKAVLLEYRRKEKLRTLGLRMLIGRLNNGGRHEDAAALKIQLAWNAHCERLAYNSVRSVWEDEADDSLATSIGNSAVAPQSAAASSPGKGGRASHFLGEAGGATPGSPGAAEGAIESRLAHVDKVLLRLEALATPLERAVKASKSGGGGSAQGSKR